jgi:hypothetical protein
MAPSEEIATTGFVAPKEMTLAEVAKAAAGRASMSSAELMARLQSATVAEGRAQVDKAELVGVSHLITSVTYRESDKGVNRITGKRGDYACIEFITVPTDGTPPTEGMYVDGGTGIRRQLTSFLVKEGVVSEGYRDEPDLPVWMDTKKEDGSIDPDPRFEINFWAARGLRVSDPYENEFTKEGRTWYIA